jgi:hypothetical protein
MRYKIFLLKNEKSAWAGNGKLHERILKISSGADLITVIIPVHTVPPRRV